MIKFLVAGKWNNVCITSQKICLHCLNFKFTCKCKFEGWKKGGVDLYAGQQQFQRNNGHRKTYIMYINNHIHKDNKGKKFSKSHILLPEIHSCSNLRESAYFVELHEKY